MQELASGFLVCWSLCPSHQFHPGNEANAAFAIAGNFFRGRGKAIQEIEQHVIVDQRLH